SRDERLGLDLSDGLVVEGDVVVHPALGQPVVGDDRDALGVGLLDDAARGLGVHGVQDQHGDPLGQHGLGLGLLLGDVLVGVLVGDLALGAEFGDRLLEVGAVELLVAGGLGIGQQQADGEALL